MGKQSDGVDHAQFCRFCGRELELTRRVSYLDNSQELVYLRCPGKRWWNLLSNNLHMEIYLRVEVSDTVLNYDSITGERLKKNVKSK